MIESGKNTCTYPEQTCMSPEHFLRSHHGDVVHQRGGVVVPPPLAYRFAVHPEVLWCVQRCYGASGGAMVHLEVLWCVQMCYDATRGAMVHPEVLWCVISRKCFAPLRNGKLFKKIGKDKPMEKAINPLWTALDICGFGAPVASLAGGKKGYQEKKKLLFQISLQA